MSSKFNVRSSKPGKRELKKIIALSLVAFNLSLAAFACKVPSIPNLQPPECTAATETVKELYSFHFGNDMKFTEENFKQREKFLSANLIENLSKREASAVDYFTRTDDYPKAFRIGKCAVAEPERRVNFAVVLFWKTDTRSEQREISVEAVKENGNWLVNQVISDK